MPKNKPEPLIDIDFSELDRAEMQIRLKHVGIWNNEGIKFITQAFKETVEYITANMHPTPEAFPTLRFPIETLTRRTTKEAFEYFYKYFSKKTKETSQMRLPEEMVNAFVEELIDYMSAYNANKMRELENRIIHEAYTAVITEVRELEDRVLEMLLLIANTFIPRSAVFVVASALNGALIQLGRDILHSRGLPEDRVYFQWEAVLDPETCDICWKRHGRIISSSNPLFLVVAPPVHPYCRCVLKPVYGEGIEEDDWSDIIGMPTDFPRTWYTGLLQRR